MGNLDWRSKVMLEIKHLGENHQVVVGALSRNESTDEYVAEFISGLRLLGVGQELRIDLPDYESKPLPVRESLQVFIKIADGSSRMMMAHPEEHKWVLSLILAPDAHLRLIAELEQWLSDELSQEFILNQSLRFAFPSNATLKLSKA
jgi:hypothetical protein